MTGLVPGLQGNELAATLQSGSQAMPVSAHNSGPAGGLAAPQTSLPTASNALARWLHMPCIPDAKPPNPRVFLICTCSTFVPLLIRGTRCSLLGQSMWPGACTAAAWLSRCTCTAHLAAQVIVGFVMQLQRERCAMQCRAEQSRKMIAPAGSASSPWLRLPASAGHTLSRPSARAEAHTLCRSPTPHSCSQRSRRPP